MTGAALVPSSALGNSNFRTSTYLSFAMAMMCTRVVNISKPVATHQSREVLLPKFVSRDSK